MANNPKLQVFRIHLNPRAKAKKKTACYKDLLMKNLNLAESDIPNLWNLYYQDIVRAIDNDFFKDVKNKKAFTIYDKDSSIASSSEKCVLDGIIKGGKYDKERDASNVNNKDNVQKMAKDTIILDQFYFLLCTPLNSTEGFLLLQTYTEDSIYSVFSLFLKNYFRCKDEYFDLKIESFTPEVVRQEYEKEAKLKGFSFTRRELIGYVGEGVEEELEEFDITIRVTPKEKKSINSIKSLLDKITPLKFKERELNQFTQRVYLSGAKNKGAYYDLEKDLESIKPTIYLEERISVDEETGLPNFTELKEYCFSLLDTIEKEIKQNEKIHEAEVLS